MRPSLLDIRSSRRGFLRGAAALGAATVTGNLLAACQPAGPATGGAPGAAPAPAEAGGLPRNETIYIAGFQWGPPTSFNPQAGTQTWPVGNQLQYLWEALFGYNLLTGELDPLLGKELTFSDETTAVVTLQDGTHWNDGTPLTSADVVYTFNLAQTHSDLRHSTFFDYVSEVTALDDTTVQFTLNPDQINPGMFRNFLVDVYVVPQHTWTEFEASGESLTQVVDMAPVASGPYKVRDASPERIVLERDENYWGKEALGFPAPKYAIHPIFKSNDDGNLALQRGEVDLSQQFVPQIWLMWEDKQLPVGTWFKEEPYYVPGSIPILFVNTHKPGLDNPQVRRALAYAINYPQIAITAMSRYSIPANASLILPEGGEASVYDADAVAAEGWSYDPAKAAEILETELGATKGSDGIYTLADGTRLGPFVARTPYGWTDWMTAINLVSQSATEAGIEVTTEFPDFPVLNTAMQQGDFDLTLWYIAGAGPASPWQRFRDVMDLRGVPEMGQQAFWNYGRFEHPDVPALMDQVAASSDPAEQKELLGQLDAIYRELIPAIPLMYRPLEFYEFNETVWTGFPTSEDPSAPPLHRGPGIRILYNIQPKA
jgi:peptide/nickel transport system substrate-binding protein